MENRDPNSQQSSKQSHQTNGAGDRDSNREQTNGHGDNHANPNPDTETSEYYRLFLRRLVNLVSSGQPDAVDRLITIIRSGASQEEIFAMLSELTSDNGTSDAASGTQAP